VASLARARGSCCLFVISKWLVAYCGYCALPPATALSWLWLCCLLRAARQGGWLWLGGAGRRAQGGGKAGHILKQGDALDLRAVL
jgi:hypothetical protein